MGTSTDVARDDRQRFLELEAAMRLARTKVALALGAVLMPAGASLDWWLLPEDFGVLLLVRLVTAALLAAGLVMVTCAPLERAIAPLSVALLLLPAAAIAVMISWGGGAASNYVFGLILLMIFVQLLGFSVGEASVYCGLCIIFYLLAVYPPATPAVGESSIVAGVFFLITSSVVCVVICQLNRRNRWTDFLLRRSLDDKNRQLEQLDGQRMDFLANISHELRTPLAMILGPLDQLLSTRGRLTADVGQPLALVRRNAQRLRVLVDDLLDVVRLDHATFRLQLGDIDAREFLQEVVQSVRPMAAARGLRLELACERELLELRADQHRLERVLLNLLSNAIKFSPPDGVVQVRLSREGDRARIDVEDQGPGVPLEQRPRVFDRLFQGNHDGGAPTGLGLGLAISREIVQWHGGEITLSDGLGERGSCFSVALPLKPVGAPTDFPPESLRLPSAASRTAWNAQAMLPQPAASGEEAEPPRSALPATPASIDAAQEHGERVLIIDDEHDLRSFLQSSLQQEFAVAAAATAAEGIALATEWLPRCILLDFMLPDADGLAVLRQLRRESALGDTKIIMVTAHFDENIKIDALRMGADDFLSKPFGITEVHARVAGLVRSSRLQGELRSEREELRQSLAKLRETEARLFQSEKMRAVASLAAGLLHEINNPINFTMMAVTSLERDLKKGRDPTEVLVDIRDGIQRIADIITDLRAFAYPQQEHVTGSFALADAVATAVRFAAHETDGIPIDASSAAAAEIRVHGAKSQITQVLLNLILNAVTALRKQEAAVDPVIRIEVRLEDNRVLVTVSDNGPGIPAAIHRRVMEPFFTTSEPGQGLGLGLSICEAIVRSHGGALAIASQEGAGTHITFDLPLAPLELDHHDQSADRQASPVCR